MSDNISKILEMRTHKRVLENEIDILKTYLQPHDTGHIHTAISVLVERVKEIEEGLNEYYQTN